MAEISTLLWDLGGVLLTNGWDRTSRRLAAERFHLDWGEFEDRHELMLSAFETGKVSLSKYLERTVFYKERPYSREEFEAFLFSQSQPLHESLALLGHIARSGRYFIGALNNESLELNDYRIQRFDLRKYFNAFFSSCYLGHRKPDPELYHLALQITQCRAEECVFVDDRALNLECAREIGMHTVLFQSAAQLREDLEREGVEFRGRLEAGTI